MMKTTLIILTLFALGACGCKTKKATTEKAVKEKTELAEDKMKRIQVDPNFVWPKTNDQVTILKGQIVNGVLTMSLEYGGGCEEHVFELVTTKMYKKSLPPQIDVYLKHNANGDACRKLFNEDHSFNVEDIKYPGDVDELIVNIHTGNGSDAFKVSYTD